MRPLLCLLGLLLLGLGPAARAQTPADTTAAADSAATPLAEVATEAADAVTRLRVRPIVSPSALYSSSRGVGVGGGVAVSNLLRGGDHLQVEGRVAQRVLGVFGFYQTADPMRSSLSALIGASVLSTSRYPFYGTGPHDDPDGKLYLDRMEWEVEGHLGWAPGGPGGLLLQPTVRYRVDRLDGYDQIGDSTLAFVSPDDRAQLDGLAGQTRSGFSAGLGLISDRRDNEVRPTRGTYGQAMATRFFSTDGSGLGFNRFEATGYLFRPMPFRLPFQNERGAWFVRAAGVVVRQDAADTLPVLYMPVLDRDLLMGWPVRSFVGRDALSLGVGMRSVVLRRMGPFRVEGIAMAMVGAAYDDVFSEFSPRLSFDTGPIASGEPVPLRPSVGAGANLHYHDRERPLVGGFIGLGPGGLSITSFRIVVGLDRYRPEIR